MKQIVLSQIPTFVRQDLALIRDALPAAIEHYGLFGSILHKKADDVGDIDALWVYSGLSFTDICALLGRVTLRLPFVCSYMNYSSKIASPPDEETYYHFIFMPKSKPDRKFLARHEGRILYLSRPFETWRIPTEAALSASI